MTAILLTIFYIKGVMTVIKCKLKGPTFTEEKRKKDKEEDILTEESVQRLIIIFYAGLNWLVSLFRDVIQWERPLKCGAITFTFITASAITQFLGDNGLLWICFFGSFFIPKLIMRRSKRQDAKQESGVEIEGDIMLTETGNNLLQKLNDTLQSIDSRIWKFSDF